jgi:hypothetical protein
VGANDAVAVTPEAVTAPAFSWVPWMMSSFLALFSCFGPSQYHDVRALSCRSTLGGTPQLRCQDGSGFKVRRRNPGVNRDESPSYGGPNRRSLATSSLLERSGPPAASTTNEPARPTAGPVALAVHLQMVAGVHNLIEDGRTCRPRRWGTAGTGSPASGWT